MKMTFHSFLLAVGLISVFFSSCATTRSASTNSTGNTLARPHHHATAPVADDNASPDGPDTFGNPLVEF
jgi:hypothetical protein